MLKYENTSIEVNCQGFRANGVEAELGALASREGGASNGSGPVYTDPEQAVEFCRETGIDVFAPSFGTAHGIYKDKPVLDLDRVKVIAEKTGLPLVMHGGSSVYPDDYRTGIRNGLRKINYYSYMSKAGTNAVKELLEKQDVTFFHDLAFAAQKAMEQDAEKAMLVFMGKSNNYIKRTERLKTLCPFIMSAAFDVPLVSRRNPLRAFAFSMKLNELILMSQSRNELYGKVEQFLQNSGRTRKNTVTDN